MIVLNYPFSVNVIRKLKLGDKLRYSGKIIVLSPEAIERMLMYSKAEGSFPLTLSGQLVCFGQMEKGEVKMSSIDEMVPLIEKCFLNGAISIVGKYKGLSSYLFKRFGRILITPLEKLRGNSKVIMYTDLKEKAVHEIEVENIVMKVSIDSRGNTYTVEVG
ncbi:MAG: hypothetical protein DRP19_04375 [Thermotogae bacterium]|nr:MAG: hypothetical protein DRP19_04375 [Thermotogota bacterium]